MASFFRSFVNVCSNATGSFASATILALSSTWTLDPADYHDLDLQVNGNFAGGRVRYAGLDDPLVAASHHVPVHLVVQVDVHVSHENLVPLVKTNVQEDPQQRSWNLQIETPGWTELPFGMVNAGIKVDVLLLFKSGRPSTEDKKTTAGKQQCDDGGNTFTPFRHLNVHVTNLSHEFVKSGSGSASSIPAASSSTESPPQPNSDEPPSYLAAVSGGSEAHPFAAVQSLRLATTNGRIDLSPGNSWRVGGAAHFTSTNGSITVSGPLRIVSPAAVPFEGVMLQATNGHASAQVQGAPLVAATSTNGRVTLNTVACTSLSAQSTNGRVDIFTKGQTQSISANSVNGRVDVTAESASQSIDAKCVNGSIGATIFPGPSPQTLLAESTHGSVTVVAAQVPPSARIEGKSYSGKAQVTTSMSDQVNSVKLEGSSNLSSVRLQVNAPNAGWPERSERSKANASLVVVRQGTEHQPPQNATVVGTSSLSTVEVMLGDASNIRT